ncbi:hypothetical protein BBF96_10290 [Anoxybacter fermentans]|uniref:Uncharacterized protein n=1 Tax=Anoxybacter fermentans TaxID=1323375 RepID=A0A3Q9HRK8_9FIRM|nr:radical SAM protein [Anoxybacter fermentans]AZR73739.1 hypothetical protein BBF96_10290 [Anoxybacter fermentans]
MGYDVLLLNAPLTKWKPEWIAPPLGLMYIGGALESVGAKVKIVDMNFPGIRLEEILKDLEPGGLLGISCFTPGYRSSTRLAALTKALRPDVFVVLGGYHASFCTDQVVGGQAPFDAAIIGPGEEPIIELYKCLGAKKIPESLPNVIFRENYVDQCINTVQCHLEMNKEKNSPLAKLTKRFSPARHLIRMEDYIQVGSRFAGSVQFSRGCLYQCYFCQVRFMEGKWMPGDIEETVEEIKYLWKKYSLSSIVLVDNLFTGSPDIVYSFCKTLRKKVPDVLWSCDARVENLDRNLVKEMAASGCRSIFMGLESGDPDTLRRIGKNPDINIVKEKLKMLAEEGIKAFGSFIIGFPWEKESHIQKTISFATELPLAWMEFSFATPLPGTRLQSELKQYGAKIVETNMEKWDGQTPVMKIPYISRTRLVDLYLEAIKAGYLRGQSVKPLTE